MVALFTIGETPWSIDQRAALVDGVRAGRTSVLAVHSATDSCYGWDDYRLLVGARFDGHPWTRDMTVDVLDPTIPPCATWGRRGRGTTRSTYSVELRPDAQILVGRPAIGTDR